MYAACTAKTKQLILFGLVRIHYLFNIDIIINHHGAYSIIITAGTMILKPSKVVLLLLFHLFLASALATAIAEEVQGQCNNENSDGSCEAAVDADSDALPAPGGDLHQRVMPGCQDKESECALWASEGECENNPNYMLREYQSLHKK